MNDIQCRKKGCQEKIVELHHLVPKYVGGIDLDGRRYLCKKHHDILHNMIPKIIFNQIPQEKREEIKQKIKEFSLRWIEQ